MLDGTVINVCPSQLISCLSLCRTEAVGGSKCRECRSILNHRASSLLQDLAASMAKLEGATEYFWAPSHLHFNSLMRQGILEFVFDLLSKYITMGRWFTVQKKRLPLKMEE